MIWRCFGSRQTLLVWRHLIFYNCFLSRTRHLAGLKWFRALYLGISDALGASATSLLIWSIFVRFVVAERRSQGSFRPRSALTFIDLKSVLTLE